MKAAPGTRSCARRSSPAAGAARTASCCVCSPVVQSTLTTVFLAAAPRVRASAAKSDAAQVIGTTSSPEKGDSKDMKNFFDKMLYLPYPDYPSRLMLWRKCIQAQLLLAEKSAHHDIPDDFDLSTLAHISEGFSAGAICQTVKKTLTHRRVERLDKRPHNESEFLNSLAQEAAKNQLTYKNDHEVFRDFTAKMTGLDDERRRAKEERDGGDGGGGGKEEKKGKKGKKGKK